MRDVSIDIELSEQDCVRLADRIDSYRDFFTQVFTVIQPRAVFLVCYYCDEAMGLIWACKNLGVKTIDVQHGKQGKYHSMYTHWTRVPEEGYELLPDYFWVWGNETKSNILRFMSGSSSHRPVVGGNLWLRKWKNLPENELDAKTKSYLEELRKYEKVILVTLQPLEKPISSLLIDAIKQSPKTWLWLLRLHPRMGEQKEDLAASLRGVAANVDVDGASRTSLYPLLSAVDFHVTGWSTVCYEALAFNIHTVIIHPNGLNLFCEYIESGLFSYADSGELLLQIIKKDSKMFQYGEKEPYIETEESVARAALEKILLDQPKLINQTSGYLEK